MSTLVRRFPVLVVVVTTVTSVFVPAGPTLATGDAEVDVSLNATPLVDPLPSLQVWADHEGHALPGAVFDYDVDLSYNLAALTVATTLTIENTGTVNAIVEHVALTLEKSTTSQSTWTALAGFSDTADGWTPDPAPPNAPESLELVGVGDTAAGVTYPESVLPIVGSEIEPAATAEWELDAAAALLSNQWFSLLNTGQTDGVRLSVHVEVSPRNALLGQPFDADDDLTGAAQALNPDIIDATVTFAPPTGSPVVWDDQDDAALAQIDLGDAGIDLQAPYAVPGDTERDVQNQTNEEYIERLKDVSALEASVELEATSTSVAFSVTASSRTPVSIPILAVEDRGDTSAVGGGAIWRGIPIVNFGGAPAATVSVAGSMPGEVVGAPTNVPSVLPTGVKTEASIQFDIPTTHSDGATTTTIDVGWTDAADNDYGPIRLTSDVWITNADAGAPEVSLDWSSETLFGSEILSVWATDDVSIASVELLIDGIVVDELTTQPYEFELDTELLNDGPHNFQARATDDGSITSTSAPATLTISNDLPAVERVAVDRNSGRLSTDEAAIAGIHALGDSSLLDSRYTDGAPASSEPSGTTDVYEALSSWHDLDAGTQDAVDAYFEAKADEVSDRLGASSGPGFDSHCGLVGCLIIKDDFWVAYETDGDAAVELTDVRDDDFGLCSPAPADPGAGTCNGVPDSIDRLSESLEFARTLYTGMGYEAEGVVNVLVGDVDRSWAAPIGEGTLFIEFDRLESAAFYLATHEFYHAVQRAYFDEFLCWDIPAPPVVGCGLVDGGLLLLHGLWWNEATAQWAAHHAQESVIATDLLDPDTTGYINPLDEFLDSPSQFWNGDEGEREYGASILAEFLEERYPSTGTFSDDQALTPDPTIIRETWDRIGGTNESPQNPLEAITSEISERGGDIPSVIAEFSRANYLLDATLDSDPVMATYRDADLTNWRLELQDNPATTGDGVASDVFISDEARPARHQYDLPDANATWIARTVDHVEVEPGGAAYLELLVPDDNPGGAYRLEVLTDDDSPIVAEVMGFSAYPTPCTATLPFEFDDIGDELTAVSHVMLPDECRSLTVMVTHGDPTNEELIRVELLAGVAEVFDAFERTVGEGWGAPDDGGKWRNATMGPVNGSVGDGVGTLPVVAGRNSAGWKIGASMDELTMVGRFTDCDEDQVFAVQFGGRRQAYLWNSGLVTAGQQFQLPDFDACAPWYLHWEQGDGGWGVTVWQATETQPDEPQLTVDYVGPEHQLTFTTIGFASVGGTARVLIAVLDLDYQPWT